MKIQRNNDEHHLIFSDEEIETIVKNRKLVFSHIAMKRFVNVLADICAYAMNAIPKKYNELNNEDDEIKLDE